MTKPEREPVLALLALVAVATLPAAASAQESRFSLGASVERISGDYGGNVTFDDLYVPLTGTYENERIALRVTVPYVEVEFQDPIDSTMYTESGLGDSVVGLTFYDVLGANGGLWSLDLTAKVELATGDENRGLGNGKTDYAVVADAWRRLDTGGFIISVGYKARGAPAGTTVNNSWLISLGGIHSFSSMLSGSLFIDQRDSAIPGRDAIREITASISRRVGDSSRIRFHVAKGLNDSSIDVAAGVSFRRTF